MEKFENIYLLQLYSRLEAIKRDTNACIPLKISKKLISVFDFTMFHLHVIRGFYMFFFVIMIAYSDISFMIQTEKILTKI